MTFDQWMNEVEVYSTRKERLMEGLVTYRDDHEFVIKWLEAAYNVGYEAGKETTGPLTYPNPIPSPFPRQIQKCSRCGISLTGAMGYVCNDAQCPTFTRVTCVTTGQHTAVQLNEGK